MRWPVGRAATITTSGDAVILERMGSSSDGASHNPVDTLRVHGVLPWGVDAEKFCKRIR
jgi:hypothetical protein